MRRKGALPELLSPAGDFEALVAAVKGGADAVYIGGKSFSARAFAKNFDMDEIRRAVRYCRLRGVKLYVTLNTLIYDKEMNEALEYAAELYRAGVDALISADVGLITLVRRYIPKLEVHASTQMSVHNSIGADAAAALGCTRVVLARELSGGDIVSVTENCKVETEVFLHGALCVCHSGQCLFSSLVGGRSGNRGECAQPCRLPYNGAYPLSLRDLSLASHIPALIDSGVASLKIEGRMKSPEYVYRVTKIYRHLLDERRCATEDELCELEMIFSRGGFTDGYFKGALDRMTGVRSDADKQSTRQLGDRAFLPERVRVTGRVTIKSGEPSELALSLGDRTVIVTGEIPSVAESSPLDAASVKARLSKMGNTGLSLSPDDIEATVEEGLNLAPSAINDLRRRAADAIEGCEREFELQKPVIRSDRKNSPRLRTAQLFSSDAAEQLLCEYPDAAGYFDILFVPLFDALKICSDGASNIGVYLPPVIMEHEMESVVRELEKVKKRGTLYTLVSNISHIELSKRFGMKMIGDFRLNVMNGLSAEYYRSLGVVRTVLSQELTLPQARDIGEGVTVYGRVPLMLTERCFIKENFGCDACGKASFKDRLGVKFPIIREWGHRNLVLNSVTTYMADRERELSENRISHSHFIFTTENASQISDAVRSYKVGAPAKNPTAIRRIGAARPSKSTVSSGKAKRNK